MGKVIHCANIFLEQGLWGFSKILIGSILPIWSTLTCIDWNRISCIRQFDFGYLFFNKFLVAKSLIVHSMGKELVVVKIVFHQKFYSTSSELGSFVTKNLRMRPHIGIERSWCITRLFRIPFEAADPDLECIHSITIVLHLLVAIFRLVKCMLLILIAHS